MSKYHSGTKYEFRQNLKPRIAPLTAAVSGVLAAGALQAATITVDTLDDGLIASKCSLRSALYAATINDASSACVAGEPGMDLIVFDSSLSGTIELGDNGIYGGVSSLHIGESVHINGEGRITIQGDGNDPVFYAKYNASYSVDEVVFSGLTITGGSTYYYGGGILSYARSLVLDGTTVTYNSAGAGGGGIFHQPWDGSGDVALFNSTISHNSSAGPGAGVHVDVTFGSWYPVFYAYATSFESNVTLSGTGGGAHVYSGDYSYVALRNSEFHNNAAKYGHGGGLYADLNYTILELYASYFIGNQASGNGGGLAFRETESDYLMTQAQIDTGSFIYNEAGGSGGGAFVEIQSFGSGGPYKSLDVQGVNFRANRSDELGGGLAIKAVHQVPVMLYGSDFQNNESRLSGGGVHADMQNSTLSMYDTWFESNETYEGRGGGMYATLEADKLEGARLFVVGNTSYQGSGGGMEVRLSDGATAGLAYSTFVYNSALGGCGGGVRLQTDEGGQAGVGHSVFVGNYASSCGGGLVLRSMSGSAASTMQAKYNEFSDNYAGPTGGGAIFTQMDDGGLATISSSTLSGNSSAGAGSAVRAFTSATNIKYSTIAHNTSHLAGGGAVSTSTVLTACDVTSSLFGFNEDGNGNFRDFSGTDICEVRRSLVHGTTGSDYQDGGDNLFNLDPKIEPLFNNGGEGGFSGASWTHALQPDSPAIDAAGVTGIGVPDTDQRGPGFARMIGPAIDMGAFESQTLPDLIFQDRFEQ